MEKYLDIDQALSYARNILEINYFLEPAAKEYIQKYRKANDVKTNLLGINIKEDGPSKIPTYKDAVKKSIKWRICWKEDQKKARFNNATVEKGHTRGSLARS